MKAIFPSIVIFLLISCTTQDGIVTTSIEEDFSAIENPKERWEAYELSNYQISQKRTCECLGIPYDALILNGSVEEIKYEGEKSEDKDKWVSKSAITVDNAFELIEKYQDEAHSIKVSYHPKYGYPTKIGINIVEMIADEEIIYRMSDLKKIKQ